MRISTKGRLAVIAMVDIALHRWAGPVSLAVLNQRQRISVSYLEQMFSALRRHGLVASTRGPGGGYSLGREASAITVADILFAVEGPPTERRPSAKDLQDAQRCSTPELWASFNLKMVEFLDAVHLQKLVDQQIARGVQPQSEVQRRALPVSATVKPSRPNAPNSVFELATFGAAR
ncbi:Rrf2 family transcriptional regulator [Variovorax guangxiensis]|uniref:Rrf2 family transcriptional regulator n=1 Tax=Variovorax guangxiensis TaxID=1775474 RepID=A0A502DT35_9BURK|nr:Rrf2 family transcriptional regulator [Variovorax guangxiensis]TPG24283.1 Rrf2 family transcriptional regulator [Variovorax ginsengisoli]TPG28533.1 Rrf2 family transcriptional regulator [Variovorax guangxiensis]